MPSSYHSLRFSVALSSRNRTLDPRWIEISELDANTWAKAQFLGYRGHWQTRPEVAFHLRNPLLTADTEQRENSAERLATPD